VVIVNEAVAALPFGVTALGDMLQAASVGAPPQLNLTMFVNVPSKGETINWYVTLLPGFRALLIGEPVRLKSMPRPTRFTTGGLPWALSLRVSVPFRVPVTVGVKLTLRVQLRVEANVEGQLLICAKSPVIWMLLMFNVAFPVLVSVTVCAALEVPTCWLRKAKLVGVTVAMGKLADPIPVRVTDWGLPWALSVKVSVPFRVPVTVGVKLTLRVQLRLAANVEGQLLIWVKSPVIW
jgi:hypothetical protein